jgi:hypothetical protein
MEYNQSNNKIALALVFTCMTSALALGQCNATKVDYDPVDLSEMTSFQKEKTEVESSDNYIDLFYLAMGVDATAYRLVVNENGSYKLTKSTKEHSVTEIRSGILTPADIEKLKNTNIAGATNYLAKCKGVTSFESAELFLVKKVGLLKIYSLDGELERTLKESKEVHGFAYCLELLNCLILKKE